LLFELSILNVFEYFLHATWFEFVIIPPFTCSAVFAVEVPRPIPTWLPKSIAPFTLKLPLVSRLPFINVFDE